MGINSKKEKKSMQVEEEWADVKPDPRKSGAKEEDEDLDLFGEDDEEAAAALKKAAEEAKQKANKKPAPVAKSLVIWEVKPYEPETDLDALGKKIVKEVVME